MPVAAEGAAIGGALAFDAGKQRGIKGIALSSIAALAGALVFSFVARRFFHGCADDD